MRAARAAWLGAALVLLGPACADILQLDDLHVSTGDDGGPDATAPNANAPDGSSGDTRDDVAERDEGGDGRGSSALPDSGEAASQDCAGARCGSAGTCVDTSTDPSNCGSCGVACPNGAKCSDGACTCPASAPLACAGACIDPTADHANCGGCGNACTNGYRCSAGACVPCSSTDAKCSGVCTDLSVDVDNCGSCGKVCPSGAVCSGGNCACPSADPSVCPTTGGNQCVNLTDDHNNCGGCAGVCSLPHATSVCTASSCAVSACSTGYTDCDKVAATGCEVNTTTDTNNCGACGTACNLPHATPLCLLGRCVAAVCSAGYTDCDLLSPNGCEVHTAADPNNCGSCGHVCQLAHATAACGAGTCAIASCAPGYKDCDGNASNGCETDLTLPASCGDCNTTCSGATPLCAASSCVSGCPAANPTLCNGGTCVNTTNDSHNCGTCGHACNLPNASSTCSSGACVIASCNAGFADCDNNAANGCETHTASDLSNCGTCGKTCTAANGTPVCSDSACGVGACNAGFADCDMLVANGCEANTTNDSSHCGGCGSSNVCTGGKTCQSSSCACPSGMHDCNGTCMSNTSVGSCGASCMMCPPPSNGVATCDGTMCGMACTSDPAHPNLCGTVCVNFSNDPGNCGMCSHPCPTGGNCAAGSCACPTGASGCPANAPTTCVNETTDNANCGACG
ncbi:MAG TPA: hypothetical protein VKU41_02310, partial [Polyangiaceae bacterium]|nr:hypothetical protein [Polyangiaceae bacterium]